MTTLNEKFLQAIFKFQQAFEALQVEILVASEPYDYLQKMEELESNLETLPHLKACAFVIKNLQKLFSGLYLSLSPENNEILQEFMQQVSLIDEFTTEYIWMCLNSPTAKPSFFIAIVDKLKKVIGNIEISQQKLITTQDALHLQYQTTVNFALRILPQLKEKIPFVEEVEYIRKQLQEENNGFIILKASLDNYLNTIQELKKCCIAILSEKKPEASSLLSFMKIQADLNSEIQELPEVKETTSVQYFDKQSLPFFEKRIKHKEQAHIETKEMKGHR